MLPKIDIIISMKHCLILGLQINLNLLIFESEKEIKIKGIVYLDYVLQDKYICTKNLA